MKKFTKWLSLLLAIVLCVSVLAACKQPNITPSGSTNGNANVNPTNGKDDPTNPPATTVPPTNPVDIQEFTQSPYITEVMGITVPVEERLPVADDIMVENAGYLEVGVYGGSLMRSADGGNWSNGKIMEEGLFRFTTQGTVEPNVAKGYEVNADATVYTIYLREGMRWSDGQPFTAEDCVWFYNYVCCGKNKPDSKGVRNCHKVKTGVDAEGKDIYENAVVEKVDDYTFTVTFAAPKYDFLEALTVDLKWHYAPKHIFETMVNAIIAGDNDAAVAEALRITGREFADAAKAGKELLYYFFNYPGVPTLNPYVLSTEEGKNNVKGEYYEFIRNPYYWKTDVKGQQLPYIDKIVGVTVSNVDQELMLLLDGTVDFQTVGADAIETILASSTDINVYEWSGDKWGDTGTQLHFNLAIADPNLNALFNNAAFREAMSICVDREVIAGVYSNGWQEGGQAAPQKGALGYSEEWATKWTEYNADKAKTLLESCGLVMGDDGFYNFADGSDFILNIRSHDEGAGETYKLLEPYFTAVGVKSTFQNNDRSIIDNDLLAGTIECMLFPVTGIGDISIALKPNSMVPGYATNVAWYGTMKKETATGDLLKLIELKEQLDVTSDASEREAIALQMLQLHEKNQWTIAYVAASTTFHAVNARIHNFLADGVWSDVYRDLGIAHVQCWFIPADQQ